jgi:hypothetical protein
VREIIFVLVLILFFSRGGVLTPGAAFGRTILMDYLEKEGMSFIQK